MLLGCTTPRVICALLPGHDGDLSDAKAGQSSSGSICTPYCHELATKQEYLTMFNHILGSICICGHVGSSVDCVTDCPVLAGPLCMRTKVPKTGTRPGECQT